MGGRGATNAGLEYNRFRVLYLDAYDREYRKGSFAQEIPMHRRLSARKLIWGGSTVPESSLIDRPLKERTYGAYKDTTS